MLYILIYQRTNRNKNTHNIINKNAMGKSHLTSFYKKPKKPKKREGQGPLHRQKYILCINMEHIYMIIEIQVLVLTYGMWLLYKGFKNRT